MSAILDGPSQSGESRTLARIGLIAGAVLAGIVLLCATAAGASAKEQVGFYLAGQESEDPEEQPRFEGEAFPTYVANDQTDEYEYVFTSGTLTCPGDYSGELPSASAQLTLRPIYNFTSCVFVSSFGTQHGVTISSNECKHRADVLNSGPPYVGQFGVTCPSESPYVFNILTMDGTEVRCMIEIPAQTGLSELSFSNTGEGEGRAVETTFDVSGLEYTLTPVTSSLGCSGTHEDGTYTGGTTLEGFDSEF